jgi:hypothetical protein
LYKIGRVVHMAKVKTIGVVCLIAMSFSSYFVVGYFFSVNSFAQTPNILSDLDTVYFKDITIDTLMAFVREDYVRNELIASAGTPWLSGTVVFLDRIE